MITLTPKQKSELLKDREEKRIRNERVQIVKIEALKKLSTKK